VHKADRNAVERQCDLPPNLGGKVTMPDVPADLAEIDNRVSIVRENLRELVEQAAAFSGAADEELMAQRIAEQQEQLDLLMKQRAQLLDQDEKSARVGKSKK
jgi:hypothetical protein